MDKSVATSFAGVVFAAVSAVSLAQEDGRIPALYSLSLEELSSVRVQVASKTNESLLQTSGTVHVITQDMIQRYGWRDLREILEAIPNVDLEWSQNLLKGGQRGFRSSFNRTLILIDGRKWNNVFAEEALIADGIYPAHQIKRVEVLQGPNASLYGTEAMAGVINIVTQFGKDGDDVMQGQYMVGEVKTRNGTGMFRTSGDNYVLGMSASTFSSNRNYAELANFHANFADYSRSPSDPNPLQRDADSFVMEAKDQTFDLYGKIKWLHGGIHFKRTYSDASMIRSRDTGSYIADRDQTMLFAGIAYPLLDELDFLIEYQNITSNDRFNSFAGTEAIVEDYFSRDHKLVAQLDMRLPMNQVIAGFEWEHRDTNKFVASDHYRSPDRRMNQEQYGDSGKWDKYTAFIQNTFTPIPQFKLTPGINFLRRQHIDNNLLFRVNAVYSPVENAAFKVTYGEGQRGPSVFEVQNAQSDLPPQLMTMLELNYSQQLRIGPVELINILAAYRMVSKNAYTTLPDDTGTGHETVASRDTFVIRGLEDSLRLRLDRLSGFLALRYALPDETEVNIGSGATERTVAEVLDIPQFKLTGGLSVRWHDHLQTSLQYQFWDQQRTQTNDLDALDNQEIYVIDAQHRFNLNIEFGAFNFEDAALSFAVYIENLLNQDFYHSNRGTSPLQYLQNPRNFRFTGRIRF